MSNSKSKSNKPPKYGDNGYRGTCPICRGPLGLKKDGDREVLFCTESGKGLHYQIGLKVFELAWEKYDKDETTAKLLVAVLVKGNEVKSEPEKDGQPAPAPDVER